jgi:hypothetical protein
VDHRAGMDDVENILRGVLIEKCVRGHSLRFNDVLSKKKVAVNSDYYSQRGAQD